MKFLNKLIATSLSVLLVQFAFAQDNSCAPPCPPKPCVKPCPPKPCPKPCAPAPCPKPCPPKPCKPCPPVCFERGYPNDQCCFPSAYNEPANYDLGPCPWDFWVDASFTYWDAQQEGMDVGVNTVFIASGQLPIDGQIVFADNSYKPGFKIGLGMDLGHDDWSGFAEYTWFRSTTTSSDTAPADSRAGTPVFSMNSWLTTSSGEVVNASSISTKWRLNMDLVDVGATRPYYQGTHLIIAPFGSMRGQFIRQNFDLTATDMLVAGGATLPSATSSNKSNSWAVGPRAGCLGKWHLGWGLRIEGDIAGSILYTRYTKTSFSLDQVLAADAGLPGVASRFKNYNCLRAVNEMNIGLGWGSYFDCRNYHLDLLLSYDFQVYWNQNMMRQLADTTLNKSGHSPSNLYLQGLTLKAQFDF